jgi:hypothetical protein
MKMAKAPKNYNDDDDDEPKTGKTKFLPEVAPKAAEPSSKLEPEVAAATTIPLDPSGGGDGEIPSQLVPYPTKEDVATKSKVKEK